MVQRKLSWQYWGSGIELVKTLLAVLLIQSNIHKWHGRSVSSEVVPMITTIVQFVLGLKKRVKRRKGNRSL